MGRDLPEGARPANEPRPALTPYKERRWRDIALRPLRRLRQNTEDDEAEFETQPLVSPTKSSFTPSPRAGPPISSGGTPRHLAQDQARFRGARVTPPSQISPLFADSFLQDGQPVESPTPAARTTPIGPSHSSPAARGHHRWIQPRRHLREASEVVDDRPVPLSFVPSTSTGDFLSALSYPAPHEADPRLDGGRAPISPSAAWWRTDAAPAEEPRGARAGLRLPPTPSSGKEFFADKDDVSGYSSSHLHAGGRVEFGASNWVAGAPGFTPPHTPHNPSFPHHHDDGAPEPTLFGLTFETAAAGLNRSPATSSVYSSPAASLHSLGRTSLDQGARPALGPHPRAAITRRSPGSSHEAGDHPPILLGPRFAEAPRRGVSSSTHPQGAMASSQYLNPAAAQAPHAKTKELAVRAARDWQAVVDEKVRKMGAADPSFEFLELIGKGAFGRVFKSKHIPTNKIVAVKIVDVDASDAVTMTSDESVFDKFLIETKIMKTLKEMNAKNINLIFDAFPFDRDVWIISEYCPGGSVATLMKAKNTPGLPEHYIIPIARELAEALKWVHSVGVIHRDVKPSNVLVGENGSVQLCDFGVSKMMELNAELKFDKRATFTGTTYYMPIELLVAEAQNDQNLKLPPTKRPPEVKANYGFEMDIWAFGCVLYELATGLPPNAKVGWEPRALAMALERKIPRLEDESYSDELRDLITMCMQARPEDRPSIEVVQQHRLLYLSEGQYPTASLRNLVEEYHWWEMSGGQRSSLFVASGAVVSDQASFTPEDDFWNYSTTENFDRSVAARRASALLPQPPPPVEDPESHPRIPFRRNALERLFDENDNYNYLDRGKPKDPPPMESTSDLPLRDHNQNSSIRDTMIDLGDFDTETGTAKIPALLTIRGNKSSNMHFHDSDEEDDAGALTYRQSGPVPPRQDDHDRDKRGTMQWTFPGLPAAEVTPAPPIPEEDDHTRRQTMDMEWKFPSLPPSTVGGTQRNSYIEIPSSTATTLTGGSSLASDGRDPHRGRGADPPASSRQLAQAGFEPGFGAANLQETMSAPVSPPDTMIDLGDYYPRPSTADSAPGPFSPGLDPDDPFGVETTQDSGPANRFSYHKQTRSDPTAPGMMESSKGKERGLHEADDDDSDGDDTAVLHDQNAKQNWKQKFYKEWKDADLFDPIPKNIKYPGEGRAHEGDGVRSGHSRRHRQRGSSTRSGDANSPAPSRLNVDQGRSSSRRREAESVSRTRSTRTHTAHPSVEADELVDEATTREAVRKLKAAHAQAHGAAPTGSNSESDDDSIFDFRGLERYVAQPGPAAPSVDALAEGADPEDLAREFERVLGAWTEGLEVIRAVMEGKGDRRSEESRR